MCLVSYEFHSSYKDTIFFELPSPNDKLYNSFMLI